MSCCTGAKNVLDQPQPGRHHVVNLVSNKVESGERRRSLNDPDGKGERLNLKRHVRQKLLHEIFDKGINEQLLARVKAKEQKQKRNPALMIQRDRSFALYVLIVDSMGSEILNSCITMTELGERRIATIEKLELTRKPMPKMEAIYVIKPDENSVLRLIEDFRDRQSALYKCAHVFFTRRLNSIYFDAISRSPIASFIRTMKELNVAFIPEESQVFNLNMPDNLFDMYSPVANTVEQHTAVDIMSEKILSLCQTIQVYPQIRYQSSPKAFMIAKLFCERLDKYNRSVDGKLSKSSEAGENVLIILERNVDTPTVLLHSMVFASLVYDILPVEKGVYECTYKNANNEEIVRVAKLDETEDQVWDEIRHLHIADALVKLSQMYKDFVQRNHLMSCDDPTLQDMSKILNQFPQYHKEILQFQLSIELSQRCFQILKQGHCSGLLNIARAEQTIVTGMDIRGRPIASIMPELAPFLTDEELDVNTKVRLLMLYVTLKNGSAESDIDKIFDCAEIPLGMKSYIINLSFLGLNILTRRRLAPNRPPVRDRPMAEKYESSRWTPYVVDLIEDILDGTLKRDAFPILATENHNQFQEDPGALESEMGPQDRSHQPGHHRKGHHHHSRVKRIIVCFIGGLTFAEMSSVHQIAGQRDVDILIGGDDIITPTTFMERVRGLRRWTALEESLSSTLEQDVDSGNLSRNISVDENLHYLPKSPKDISDGEKDGAGRGAGGGASTMWGAKKGQLREPNSATSMARSRSDQQKSYWQRNTDERTDRVPESKKLPESKKKSFNLFSWNKKS